MSKPALLTLLTGLALAGPPTLAAAADAAAAATVAAETRASADYDIAAEIAESEITAEASALDATTAASDGTPRMLEWADLLPPVDDPDQAVAQLFDSYDLDKLLESDDALNDFIDKATDLNVNMALDGKLVSLPGFVLPLETTGTATSEFLLLPYHGACIHVPPPPINQTVYVKMRDGGAAKIRGLFDTLMVTGILYAEKNVTGFANAGYRIDAIAAGRYR